MPIIGIMASANWSSANASSFESIASYTASGGETSFTFSSIPGTYSHLQLRAFVKDSSTSDIAAYYMMQFNSDTAGNYVYHRIQGDGSSVAAAAGTGNSQAYVYGGATSSDSNLSNLFGASIVDIIDYANTSKNKTISIIAGNDGNRASTNHRIVLVSNLWRSTSAITTIKVINGANGTAFAAGTTFALYGIK